MPALTRPVSKEDHRKGPMDASVTLVEYGDFQCPHCRAAAPILNDIVDQVGDDLCFVWRQFPLTMSHPMALPAAEASEAAAAQGKFWDMHDLIFEYQDDLSEDTLYDIAHQLGLEMQQFRSDMESHHYQEHIEDDFNSGVRSGANGTPTFFINGERYDGPWENGELLDVIQQVSAESSQ